MVILAVLRQFLVFLLAFLVLISEQKGRSLLILRFLHMPGLTQIILDNNAVCILTPNGINDLLLLGETGVFGIFLGRVTQLKVNETFSL